MIKITWTKEEIETYNYILSIIKNLPASNSSQAFYIDKLEKMTSIFNMKHRGLMIGETDYDN